MGKPIDLIGKTFGKLTVESRAANSGRAPMWNCMCSCGNPKVVNGGSLRRGSTTSCGCARMSKVSKIKAAVEGKTSNKHVIFLDGKYCALDDNLNLIQCYVFISDAIRARKNWVEFVPVTCIEPIIEKPVIKKPVEPVVKKPDNYPGIKLKPNGKWLSVLYIAGKGISCGTHETQALALAAQVKKRKELK